ncbi:MAG: sensor histidine kinase [Anaerolineae bacterium]
MPPWLAALLPVDPSLSAPEQRAVRLLQSILLTMGVLIAVAIFVVIPVQLQTNPAQSLDDLPTDPAFIGGLVAFIITGVSYFLSRTARYRLGALVFIGALVLGTFGVAATATAEQQVHTFFMYGLLPIVLASIFLNLPETALVAGVMVFGPLLLLPLSEAVMPADVLIAMPFLIVFAVMLMVFKQYRDRLESDRQDELRQFNIALTESGEEARAAEQVAREASRLKSAFLANTSHELCTPLNAIIGFTEIMLMQAEMVGDLDEDTEHMVKRIEKNSKRLLALINDILDLSKIESQHLEVTAHYFNPRELARRAYQEMESLVEDENVVFNLHLGDDLPEELVGDKNLIRRIVDNLLSNAFKFTERGHVTLAMARSGRDDWYIAVEDTGIGISPHEQEIIFDAFRQADDSTTREYGGTGLGLSIVERLTRKMGGHVELQSERDVGTTFTIHLPLTETEREFEQHLASEELSPV